MWGNSTLRCSQRLNNYDKKVRCKNFCQVSKDCQQYFWGPLSSPITYWRLFSWNRSTCCLFCTAKRPSLSDPISECQKCFALLLAKKWYQSCERCTPFSIKVGMWLYWASPLCNTRRDVDLWMMLGIHSL